MGDARKAALTVLERCRRSGAWSDAVLGNVMDSAGLEERDRALATAICYGTLQNRMLLDHILQAASTAALNKVEPKVLDILRISAYQLLFMEKIPASAAVNEGVKLCRALGFSRAAGYVNAVLRRLSRQHTPPELPKALASRLSIQYSHPKWLVEALLQRLGEEEASCFLALDNQATGIAVQVNTQKTTAEELMDSLRADGLVCARHPVLANCLSVQASGDLKRCAAFQKGWFYVQDAAAFFAVSAAGIQKGQRILDTCAAPGGKTFAAVICAGGDCGITSCDIHPNKLKRIQEGAERLGFGRQIHTFQVDARNNRAEWNGQYDLVITDVPCSGLGVIRKKPDIRYKNPEDFQALPALQLQILRNAAQYVKPGGTLLYSTCTIRTEENEAVVTHFLNESNSFHLERFYDPWEKAYTRGTLQLWPQRHGTDGFFIAKLRKEL